MRAVAADVYRSGLQRNLPETTSPNCCSIEAHVWMPPMTAGATALMSTGMRGNQPPVELLLERGANPQLTVGNDKTAVSYAREEGHSEIAALLQKRAWNHTSRH